MRRLIPFACVAITACSTSPAPQPTSAPAPAVTTEHGPLVGLTRSEVGQRFGLPDLTVQEGPGAKVQYRVPSCVLDLYLYRPENGQGDATVAHVDARDREGGRVNQATCAAAVSAR